MDSLNFQYSQMGFDQRPQICKPLLLSSVVVSGSSPNIICRLRNGPRKPVWRKSVLSIEAIQAFQSLKQAKSSPKLEEGFSSRIRRLLKADLLDVLAVLQRQNQLDLALKVFEFVRKEVWYESDLYLFCDMIMMSGKNRRIEMAEELFSQISKEGLEPNTRAYTERIGVYFKVDMIQKAMETYELMKASGCVPDKLTLTIMIRNLEKSGEEGLAARVKKECSDYMDFPERFLEEVQRKHPRQRSLKFLFSCIKLQVVELSKGNGNLLELSPKRKRYRSM